MTFRNGSKATRGCFLAVITGLAFLFGCGSGSTSINNTTPASNNTAPLTVGFGALGPSGGYVNGLWISVTICVPGSTTSCQAVDNVLVDTGSFGLRVLGSALTNISVSSLGALQNSSGDQLQECVQYGDTSYTWGPLMLADVGITGEKAPSIPIQIIGGTSAGVPSQCLATPVNPTLPNGGNDDTLEALGANGILGIGGYPWDCGSYCTSPSNLNAAGYPYHVCPAGQVCSPVNAQPADQATNPVAAFSSSDNNGVLVTLPSVPATGAVNGTITGSLIFGIETQSNNALAGSATVYGLDQYGNIPQVTYKGVQYTSPSNTIVLDTGSEAINFLDATTLASVGIVDCTDAPGYYCPTGTILFSVTLSGANSTSGTITFSITNADTLFASGNAAVNDLGGDGGTGPSNDSLDFGLAFFFGRSVYVGMMPGLFSGESAAPSAATSTTYGYYAF